MNICRRLYEVFKMLYINKEMNDSDKEEPDDDLDLDHGYDVILLIKR